MTAKEHFRSLEHMYRAAPINDFYAPKLVVELSDKCHHAAGAVHGSVYFKCSTTRASLRRT